MKQRNDKRLHQKNAIVLAINVTCTVFYLPQTVIFLHFDYLIVG